MNIEQERAAFEVWRRKHYDYDDLTAFEIEFAFAAFQAGRAALQSQDQVDAERYRYLISMATQQADTLGPIFRIDVRRTPQTLFDFDAAVDHARHIEG